MKRLRSLLSVSFLLLLLFGTVQGVLAGWQEEVAQAFRQNIKAFNEGDLEAFMALRADDVQAFFATSPFRFEGKEVVRGFFAGLFKAFPTRSFVPFQTSIQLYGDSTAVLTSYLSLTFVDGKGEVTRVQTRINQTWVKRGGKWLIVNSHNSRLPVSP